MAKNSKKYVVVVENLFLTIKDAQILKNISVKLESGNIYGLIGRNGSGKSMLMKCLCGFVIPTAGEVYVNEKHIGVDCDFPDDVGVIIESPGFIPYYSGHKNLKLLADLRERIGDEDIDRVMRQVGLNPELKLHVSKYSLGMKQRLGLAQAIMEDPSLLILDEPMNGLDKEGVADMRNYLLDQKSNSKTILIASHSAEDIDVLCDHVYEMEHGVMEQIR